MAWGELLTTQSGVRRMKNVLGTLFLLGMMGSVSLLHGQQRLLDRVSATDAGTRHDRKETVCLPSRDQSLAILQSIFEMHTASTDDLHAALFETGGGDPAYNGSILYLVLGEDDFREGNEYLFDPELNVYQIESFGFKGNALVLRVTEHVERKDDVVTMRVEYEFRFTRDDAGHLNETLRVRRTEKGMVEEGNY
jgi:hypothetical protein